jgi:CheY-like chemotaxis protein
VEDEDLVREVVTKILTEAGFKVVTAVEGEGALRKIYASHDWGPKGVPDLILADILMPGMDGLELCKRVKANPTLKSVPFMFLTVKRGVMDRAQGYLAGCQRYILKPFKHKDLLQAVNERLIDAAQTRALLTTHDKTFEGELIQLSALAIVDLFLIQGWSGTATFKVQDNAGRIEFASGEVVKAVWNNKEGEHALASILTQIEGTYRVERSEGEGGAPA